MLTKTLNLYIFSFSNYWLLDYFLSPIKRFNKLILWCILCLRLSLDYTIIHLVIHSSLPTKKYFILNHDQHSFKQIKESRRKTRRDNNNAILRKQIFRRLCLSDPSFFLFSLSLSFDQTYSAFFKKYVCYFLCFWLITFLLEFLTTYCCHIVNSTKKYPF